MPISKSKHPLPSPLIPVGDICYPLYIPDDDNYRNLVLGAIRALTEDDYYREVSYNLTDVQTVTEQWRTRTLTPLVQAISDNDGCGVSNMSIVQYGVTRTTNQGLIAANSPNSIIWSGPTFDPLGLGAFDAANPTRLNIYADGIVIITFNGQINCVNAITFAVEIWRNGVEMLAKDFSGVAMNNHFSHLAWQYTASEDDWLEVKILHAQNSTLIATGFDPSLIVTQFIG